MECDTTSDWLTIWLCYIQLLLNTEKSGELDEECSIQTLGRVNTDPGLVWERAYSHSLPTLYQQSFVLHICPLKF